MMKKYFKTIGSKFKLVVYIILLFSIIVSLLYYCFNKSFFLRQEILVNLKDGSIVKNKYFVNIKYESEVNSNTMLATYYKKYHIKTQGDLLYGISSKTYYPFCGSTEKGSGIGSYLYQLVKLLKTSNLSSKEQAKIMQNVIDNAYISPQKYVMSIMKHLKGITQAGSEMQTGGEQLPKETISDL